MPSSTHHDDTPPKTPRKTTRAEQAGSRRPARAVKPRKTEPTKTDRRPPDPTATAERKPPHLGFEIRALGWIVLLEALSLALMSLIFAPLDQWYLAYVCLVPWLVATGSAAVARRLYLTSWLFGFAFFLINMHWMEASTGAGYIALSAFLACYFPLAACPVRHAVRRRRIPLVIVFPIVWTAVELLRGIVLSGFPWFLLAHSQYKILPIIQISDVVGAYGVSFLIAAANGALADLIFAKIGRPDHAFIPGRNRRATFSMALAATLAAAALTYGFYQLSRDTMTEGPRIALLQRNYPNYTDMEKVRAQPGPMQKQREYFDMMAQTLPEKPDLYLFPETAWAWMYLNKEFIEAPPEQIESEAFRSAQQWSRNCYRKLQDWAAQTGASIVIGSTSVTPTPLSLRAREILHNSAFHFRPDRAEPERHDKTHPVLFGEIIPFRFGRLRFLYFWFNRLSPFGSDGFEYSLFPGKRAEVFTLTTRDGRSFRFGVPICYEDVMPYVCRRFVWDRQKKTKRVDFLANISNDGWFLHGNELPQHFAICTFRAVENRVGIARTVNTGISGFIRPDGSAHDTIGVAQVGYRVAPVTLDSRVSLYSRIGDAFAVACSILAALICLDYVLVRIFSRTKRKPRLNTPTGAKTS